MSEWITKRCHQCRTILLKHEPGAFVDGRRVEVKCKCNAMNYIAEFKAEPTPEFTQGRSKAGTNALTGIDRRADHEGTAREARQAHR